MCHFTVVANTSVSLLFWVKKNIYIYAILLRANLNEYDMMILTRTFWWKDSSKQCQTEHWMCLCGVSFPACIAVLRAHSSFSLIISTVSWAAVLSAVCRVWWEMCVSSGPAEECCISDRSVSVERPFYVLLTKIKRFKLPEWFIWIDSVKLCGVEGVCRVETDECDS